MVIAILLLVFGFVILVKGADLLVDGASSLAKRFSISEIAIGLTIVAFGTSAPELIVNIFSTITGHDDIAFGNILGSNIFNILVVLGIAGLISPISVQKNTVRKEIPFLFFGTLVLFGFANNFGFPGSSLNRIDGAILLILLLSFFYYVMRIAISKDLEVNIKILSVPKTLIFILLGIAGLLIGGDLVVKKAIFIARELNVSEKFISLTIVALGTSLPELVTSIIAVSKKRYDLAIGNVVGSNLFNIFFVLGTCSVIAPIKYDPILNVDFMFLIIITFLFFLTMFTGKKHKLDRWEAFLFVIFYAIYIVFLFYRR
ncbi:MAG: calcium/sodium antiporter [Armatimonadetes bacterium]|nr:calcium/sodium antiporter [Armatimonadota bacterium]